MPYLADFKCPKCGNTVFDMIFENYAQFEELKGFIECGDNGCAAMLEQVWTKAPGIEIKEGFGMESSKPGSYWRNAERNRLTALKKRKDIEKEKIQYKDPETIKKLERKRINQQQFADED